MMCAFSPFHFFEWTVCIIVPCPVIVHESYDLEYSLDQCFMLQSTGSVKVKMEIFVSSDNNET